MNINDVLKQATPFIEWTYDKKLDLYGEVEYTKPSGATGFKFDVVTPDIPCRVSVVKLTNTEQDQANQLHETLKLFCGPSIKLPAGSKLVVDGVNFETSEEPMVYVTHQEVYIHRKSWV